MKPAKHKTEKHPFSVVVHIQNLSIWEVEARRSQVQAKPEQLSKTLFQNEKLQSIRNVTHVSLDSTPSTKREGDGQG